MIVITGSVTTSAVNRAAIEALAIEHCRRSRAEPGCIAHNVHADCEQLDRLVFLELWADAGAVKAHFALPGARAFVRDLRTLASIPPQMKIYRAEEVAAEALG